MTSMSKNTLAYIYAGFTVFLWASAFPGVKYALDFYTPGAIMLFRFGVASVTLLIISLFKGARFPERADIPYAAAGGAIGIFCYMWLFNTGTSMVKSGVSSFLIATAPIFSMLLSFVFLNEKISLNAVIGVLISAFGLLMIAAGQAAELSLNVGIPILLLAAISASAYNVIQKKISAKYSPIECATYSIVIATVFMLVFLPELVYQYPNAPFNANAVIVYMGVFPAAIAYLSWNYALGLANTVTGVAKFMYLVPFIASALSFFFLNEVLSALSLIGGIVIVLGMIYAGRKQASAIAKNVKKESEMTKGIDSLSQSN